jgi:hypothetical protein
MSVSADGLEIVSGPPGSKRGQNVPAGFGGDVEPTTDSPSAFAPGKKNGWWVLNDGALETADGKAILVFGTGVTDSIERNVHGIAAKRTRIKGA